jgi:hypothetical protein
MTILDRVKNLFSPNLQPQKVLQESSEKAVNSQISAKKRDKSFVDIDFNRVWNFDAMTDDLMRELDSCGNLLNVEDPRMYINYSNLIYRIFPLYKRAIQLKAIFIGTIDVLQVNENKVLSKAIKAFKTKIPIYDSNSLIAKSFGINSLNNMIVEDCCKYGMSFVKSIRNPRGAIIAYQIFKPDLFYFSYNSKSEKKLYYINSDNEIDTNEIYIYMIQGVRGYDWGAPLIYGGRFMADSLISLINAQKNGLMRNMNPFDVTVVGLDAEKFGQLDPDYRDDIKEKLIEFRKNYVEASKKSLRGEAVNLFVNIPSLSTFNNVKGASTVSFIDSQTLFLYTQFFCNILDVPISLILNVSGSMNTDQSKAALLQMEAWASEYGRPQLLPTIEKMAYDYFFSHGFLVTEDDIEVVYLKNETMLSTLNSKTTNVNLAIDP